MSLLLLCLSALLMSLSWKLRDNYLCLKGAHSLKMYLLKTSNPQRVQSIEGYQKNEIEEESNKEESHGHCKHQFKASRTDKICSQELLFVMLVAGEKVGFHLQGSSDSLIYSFCLMLKATWGFSSCTSITLMTSFTFIEIWIGLVHEMLEIFSIFYPSFSPAFSQWVPLSNIGFSFAAQLKLFGQHFLGLLIIFLSSCCGIYQPL